MAFSLENFVGLNELGEKSNRTIILLPRKKMAHTVAISL